MRDSLSEHVTNAPVFVHLYQVLTKAAPCTPFADVLSDVLDSSSSDDESNDESTNESKDDAAMVDAAIAKTVARIGSKGGDSNHDDAATTKADEANDHANDHTKDDTEHVPSFRTYDDLFRLHVQWLATYRALQSCPTEYVRWATEAREWRQKKDASPLTKSSSNRSNSSSSNLWNKRPSPFDDLRATSAFDIVHKRTKQRTDALARLNTTFDTYHDDAPTRAAQLRKWEEEVVGAWANVVPLLRLYGTRMDKPSVETLQWLHTQEVVPRGFLSCVDVAYTVSAFVTPYTLPLVSASLGTHALRTVWTWATTGANTLFQHTPFSRATLALLALQQLHPHLRSLHTSVYAVRSDVLLGALGLWVSGAGLPALVAWLAVAQVYVYCWADVAWCTARVGFTRM